MTDRAMSGKRRNTTEIHYDPTWSDRGLCGVTVERNAPIVLTSDRRKVTCGACVREIINALGPMRCAVCGGEGEHDWEVHTAELRAIDDAGPDY